MSILLILFLKKKKMQKNDHKLESRQDETWKKLEKKS